MIIFSFKNFFKNKSGQATVEYILLFGFMMLVGLNMAKLIGDGLSRSVRGLGYALTQELSTGVCEKLCFYTGYKNEKK